MLSVVPNATNYAFCGESFPTEFEKTFRALFEAHGNEVRGRPLRVNFTGYRALQDQGRLVCIVARDRTDRLPVGYSVHYWYLDLNFSDKVGVDGLWYVHPDHRGRGVGRRLRELGLNALRMHDVKQTSDLIRLGGPDLTKYGYEPWGTRWVKTL